MIRIRKTVNRILQWADWNADKIFLGGLTFSIILFGVVMVASSCLKRSSQEKTHDAAIHNGLKAPKCIHHDGKHSSLDFCSDGSKLVICKNGDDYIFTNLAPEKE